MRAHKRFNVVPLGVFAVEKAVIETVEKLDLTDAEYGQVLTQVFSNLLGSYFKMQIRVERHGTTEKEGDLE